MIIRNRNAKLSTAKLGYHLYRLFCTDLKVGIFPDLEGNVWIMEPDDLLEALKEECEQYL